MLYGVTVLPHTMEAYTLSRICYLSSWYIICARDWLNIESRLSTQAFECLYYGASQGSITGWHF